MILPYQLCDISDVLTQNKYYRSHPRYRIPASVISCLLWRDMLFRFGRMASALYTHPLIPRKTHLLSALHSPQGEQIFECLCSPIRSFH